MTGKIAYFMGIIFGVAFLIATIMHNSINTLKLEELFRISLLCFLFAIIFIVNRIYGNLVLVRRKLDDKEYIDEDENNIVDIKAHPQIYVIRIVYAKSGGREKSQEKRSEE